MNGDQVFGLAAVTPTLPAGVAASVQAAGIDMNQRTSYSAQWTMTVQRELMRDVAFEIGYLANVGLKLEQNVQPNNAQPSTNTQIDPRRPFYGLTYANGMQFPYYLNVTGNVVPVGFINYLPHSAQSNYESMFVRLEKRFNGGFSLADFLHFLEGDHQRAAIPQRGHRHRRRELSAAGFVQPGSERGLASFDTRHRFVNTYRLRPAVREEPPLSPDRSGLLDPGRMADFGHPDAANRLSVHHQPHRRYRQCGRWHRRHFRPSQRRARRRLAAFRRCSARPAQYFNTRGVRRARGGNLRQSGPQQHHRPGPDRSRSDDGRGWSSLTSMSAFSSAARSLTPSIIPTGCRSAASLTPRPLSGRR